MLEIPTEHRKLVQFASDLVEKCSVSVAVRKSYYRVLNAVAETGRIDGTRSLINMLHQHLDRTAAHLYSPVELKFAVDFENRYPRHYLDRAAVVANQITREWERSNTDMLWGQGVFEALKYGICVLKQWVQEEPGNETGIKRKLVMPWRFGVYREDENDIANQTALYESINVTMPEVWQRIYHLPEADKLYKRIEVHAHKGSIDEPDSFFHQVLSTSQLQTGVQQNTRPIPGGIVQLNSDPNYAIMGPEVAAPIVQMHELWVQAEDDYKCIQLIEPDILITRYAIKNLLIPGSRLQPYRIIQPNTQSNYFWGRSELIDLIDPQSLLSTWCDDLKRLFGLQADRILAFIGETTMTDEIYGQRRGAGFFSMNQGGEVKDLTPNIPPEAIPILRFLIEIINTLGGFPEIMQGRGEPGVRAGTHANTLLKTASPTLRDRSLLVERQIAAAADLTLSLKQAKDPQTYWTNGESLKTIGESSFKLTDLPDDWRVAVSSHSSSPIFSDEHTQLIVAGLRFGFIDGEYAIDELPYPDKEMAKAKLREKQKREAEMLQQHPELLEKILAKGKGHHR